MFFFYYFPSFYISDDSVLFTMVQHKQRYNTAINVRYGAYIGTMIEQITFT